MTKVIFMLVLCKVDKAMIWTKVQFATQLLVQTVALSIFTVQSGTNILEKPVPSAFSVDIHAYDLQKAEVKIMRLLSFLHFTKH
jgi:hypothetical protein